LLGSASRRVSIELLTRFHCNVADSQQQDCFRLVLQSFGRTTCLSIRSAITCPLQGETNGAAQNENV
jgi:hypothetical protein